MKDYITLVQEDVRLAILEVLEAAPDYSHNSGTITSFLSNLGFKIDRDECHKQMEWLKKRGLISVEYVCDMRKGLLTDRGEDLVLGRLRVDGVARKKRV